MLASSMGQAQGTATCCCRLLFLLFVLLLLVAPCPGETLNIPQLGLHPGRVGMLWHCWLWAQHYLLGTAWQAVLAGRAIREALALMGALLPCAWLQQGGGQWLSSVSPYPSLGPQGWPRGRAQLLLTPGTTAFLLFSCSAPLTMPGLSARTPCCPPQLPVQFLLLWGMLQAPQQASTALSVQHVFDCCCLLPWVSIWGAAGSHMWIPSSLCCHCTSHVMKPLTMCHRNFPLLYSIADSPLKTGSEPWGNPRGELPILLSLGICLGPSQGSPSVSHVWLPRHYAIPFQPLQPLSKGV